MLYRQLVVLFGAFFSNAFFYPLAVASEPADNINPLRAESDALTSQPNADVAIAAGQCWIYGQIKPRPVEQKVEVTLKDSHYTIQVTPAEIRQGFKQVVTREGTVTYRIEPPTYKTVLEKVLVRPEVTRFVVVPAVYETREKNITVEEAQITIERCRAAGTRYARNTNAIAFCAQELPAKQEVVQIQELVQPESTQVEIEPAEYKTVVRKVIDQPARVVEVALNPQVTIVPVEEVVAPSQTHQLEIPAVTQEMQVTTFEGEPRMVMRKAVCNDEITPTLITNLQEQLHRHGYQAGPVDGLLGKYTLEALSDYQVDNGLAVGAVTYESLEHLGVAGR